MALALVVDASAILCGDDVVIFSDKKTVSCLKCETIIHELGLSHVDRVRQHMSSKCSKRLRTAKLTSIYQSALSNVAKFHQVLADWAYETGISFNSMQHHGLQDALTMLHPDATVPSDKAIRTRLVDAAYDASIERMKVALRGTLCTVTTDAWTDINGFSVINYVAISGDHTFFLESVYTDRISHDTKYLSEDLARVIDKYQFIECVVLLPTTLLSTRPCGRRWGRGSHVFSSMDALPMWRTSW